MSEVTVSAHADVVVIVSAKSPVTSLTVAQTTRIFLGKVNTFPDDGDAFPVDQAEGSAIRDEFYSKVVHKSPSQLAAYWAKVIFTGDGRPPEMLESDMARQEGRRQQPEGHRIHR
jgi:ABC-type phosphate transport system substrate-binding protein